MKGSTALRLAVPTLLLLCAAWGLVADTSWAWLWLLVAAGAVWEIVRVLRPRPPRPAAGDFTEPGKFRAVLQVPGAKPIHVIREIRLVTGADLLSAKQMIDNAPVVVAENLSEQSAERVAERLRAAGARAVATPIGEM